MYKLLCYNETKCVHTHTKKKITGSTEVWSLKFYAGMGKNKSIELICRGSGVKKGNSDKKTKTKHP